MSGKVGLDSLLGGFALIFCYSVVAVGGPFPQSTSDTPSEYNTWWSFLLVGSHLRSCWERAASTVPAIPWSCPIVPSTSLQVCGAPNRKLKAAVHSVKANLSRQPFAEIDKSASVQCQFILACHICALRPGHHHLSVSSDFAAASWFVPFRFLSCGEVWLICHNLRFPQPNWRNRS